MNKLMQKDRVDRVKLRLTRDERRTQANMVWAGFYRCPTDGHIIEAMSGDDKALCVCRRSNPAVPSERTELTGVHIIRFLQAASVDDYLDQCEAKA